MDQDRKHQVKSMLWKVALAAIIAAVLFFVFKTSEKTALSIFGTINLALAFEQQGGNEVGLWDSLLGPAGSTPVNFHKPVFWLGLLCVFLAAL